MLLHSWNFALVFYCTCLLLSFTAHNVVQADLFHVGDRKVREMGDLKWKNDMKSFNSLNSAREKSLLDIGTTTIVNAKETFSRIDTDDQRSFVLSFLMIIVSEIGDKTFLIAAIMAMKHSRLLVFSAAFCALIVMSVLSATLGHVVPNLIPQIYTNYIAAVLFLFFGIKMVSEGWNMSPEEANQELEEVTAELKEKEEAQLMAAVEKGGVPDVKSSGGLEGLQNLCQLLFSPVFVQTFVLTFLGEWGDRSQIATIALAAAQNVYLVMFGTIMGHSMCTALAVIGGRMLAQKISLRTGKL
ncbi:7618_t:CDS:2 [Ambispora gerdemannii]|uniref:GDT1 family protein n=1 Tax=Ambispora gerdemannii TaxID=144530 RepID=A0A9N8V3K5_9GLOM|nr:7618_t:CDS:2 [Ambispora gerdemannii]